MIRFSRRIQPWSWTFTPLGVLHVDNLEGMSSDNEDIVFCKVNVDENVEIAKRYVVRSIPTVKYIKDGEVVDTSMGMQPKQNILEHLEKLK